MIHTSYRLMHVFIKSVVLAPSQSKSLSLEKLSSVRRLSWEENAFSRGC